jgi:hypothetical protein
MAGVGSPLAQCRERFGCDKRGAISKIAPLLIFEPFHSAKATSL